MNDFLEILGSGLFPWYAIALAVACAYFLGNVNPAILLGRAAGVDVRAQGSGNAGATNAMRSLGKKAGALTFVIDVVKGWAGYSVPSFLLLRVTDIGHESLRDLDFAAAAIASLCGLAVVLGHMYPAVFGFRGGKGVATTFGVLLAASPLYALCMFAVVLVFTIIFRRVSLSVLIAVAVALVFAFSGGGILADFTGYQPLWIAVLLALVVWKHRANIARLVQGKEPKLSFGGGKKRAEGEEKSGEEK